MVFNIFKTTGILARKSNNKLLIQLNRGIFSPFSFHSERLLSTRTKISRETLRTKSGVSQRKAEELCGAPSSISSIIDGHQNVLNSAKKSDDKEIPGAVIRSIGCTRRVFLLKPYLSKEEIEGLAYRVRTLSKNDYLNSVLIAASDEDDINSNCLPSSVLEYERLEEEYDHSMSGGSFDPSMHAYHLASGYDPVSASNLNKDEIENLLEGIKMLALATRGDPKKSCIPTITIPNGTIEDGGYSLCLSSYVIATDRTSLRLKYASRGLSFDPIGYSYILPRLGWEYNQISAKYSETIGFILALMGYEADASDLVEVGLATHYMENCDNSTLATFERTLGELPAWNQQEFIKRPRTYTGGQPPLQDHNNNFRNRNVANMVYDFTDYNAGYGDIFTADDDNYDIVLPAYKDCDPQSWHAERTSTLVNVAATFDEIFKKQESLLGIYIHLKELSERVVTKSGDPEEQQGIDIAKKFVQHLEQASPLSLCVMHKLIKLGTGGHGDGYAGGSNQSSLQACMDREKNVQSKMFKMPDYANWVQHAKKALSSTNKIAKGHAGKGYHEVTPSIPPFTNWKYKNIADVPNDLVEELVS